MGRTAGTRWGAMGRTTVRTVRVAMARTMMEATRTQAEAEMVAGVAGVAEEGVEAAPPDRALVALAEDSEVAMRVAAAAKVVAAVQVARAVRMVGYGIPAHAGPARAVAARVWEWLVAAAWA